jgi:TRAP-type C4-dicarboxylate transport system permease small subunit
LPLNDSILEEARVSGSTQIDRSGGIVSRTVRAVDRLSIALSCVSAIALLAIALVVCYEVAARYIFNSPTIWAWDVSSQLMVLLLMLGLGEVYRRDLNVRVDVVTELMPGRLRLLLDLLMGVFALFVVSIIVWTSWDYFLQSFNRGQRASSLFAPPIWPAKFLLWFGAVVLVMQVVATLVRDTIKLLAGRAETESASAHEKELNDEH